MAGRRAARGWTPVLVSAFILVTGGIRSDFSSLYLLPIIAASTIRARRGALQVAALSALRLFRHRRQPVRRASRRSRAVGGARARSAGGRASPSTSLATNVCGFVGGRRCWPGSLAERPALGRRQAGRRLRGDRGPAGLQRARDRQPRQRPGDRRRRLARADVQPAAAAITGVRAERGDRPRRARRCWRCRRRFVDRLAHARTARGRQRGDFAVRDRRRPRRSTSGVTAAPLPFPDGRTGHLFTFQDVTDVKRLERDAGRARAAGGGGRDGRRHRPRDPQPAGLDVGIACRCCAPSCRSTTSRPS